MWTSLLMLMLAAEPDAKCGPQRQATNRSCIIDADCVAVTRVIDCCGSQRLEGVNEADAARFEAEERVCSRELKTCKCEAAPTRLDDGSVAQPATTKVEVVCRAKQCRTQGAKLRLTSETVKALPMCPPAQCGPAPKSPNWECPDGVSVGGRGPCARVEGKCQWTRLVCP